MTEELLRSIRDLLIAQRAIGLRNAVRESDPVEDSEETGRVLPDGRKERRLTMDAALRIAVEEHKRDAEIIKKFLP